VHYDMPRNATSAGSVDSVLLQRSLPGSVNISTWVNRKPRRLSRRCHRKAKIDQIFAMLRKSSGVDFSNYQQTCIPCGDARDSGCLLLTNSVTKY